MKRLVLFSLILFLAGCSKDNAINSDDQDDLTNLSQKNLSIENAQLLLYGQEKNGSENYYLVDDKQATCSYYYPIWHLARESHFLNDVENSFLFVPITVDPNESEDISGAELVFYNSEVCDGLTYDILFFSKDSRMEDRCLNTEEFTGVVTTLSHCNCESYVHYFDEGILMGTIENENPADVLPTCMINSDSNPSKGGAFLIDWFKRNRIKCPNFSCGGGGIGGLLRDIGKGIENAVNWVGGLFSGGSSSSSGNGFIGSVWRGSENVLTSTGTGGGGGGTTNSTFDLSDFYGQGFFAGQWGIVTAHLEDLIDKYDLMICTEDLHNQLYNCMISSGGYASSSFCSMGEGYSENDGDLSLDDYNNALFDLSINPNDPCISTIINQYGGSSKMELGDGVLVCAIEEINEFDLSTEDFLAMLKSECDSHECKAAAIECIARLRGFQNDYGITLDGPTIQQIIFNDTSNLCDLNVQGLFNKKVAEKYLLILNNTYFNESPTLTDFQNDQDGSYLGRLKDAAKALRAAGVDWYADFIEELIECEEFETVGDLRDTWYMVKDFISEYNQFIICQREEEQAEWMMAIFSPDNVGMILGFATFGQNMSPSYRAAFRVKFASHAKALCSDLSKGFDTFYKFKKAHGNAGSGKQWHHIVEQNQIQHSGFNPKMIHHSDNLVKIEGGFSGSWHSKITGAYAKNGKYAECGGLSLREWLKGKSFETQYEWGIRVMRELKP